MRGLLLLLAAIVCLSAFVDGALVKQSMKKVAIKPYSPSEVNCPISGEKITVNSKTATLTFNNGQSLYFCCNDCLESFLDSPSKYTLVRNTFFVCFYSNSFLSCFF
eukprot:TRINITY_DN298_c0_g1_i1.p1 TRINITY_DN298_c0_g1~~TRINITY_DN298_c0_g1_i1.p1  ORF type:complete len:106 (+),score=16.84 TRINITY_DN298_c0_g1_i1:259-576(+)